MKIPPRKMHTESWWNVSYEGYTKFRRSLFIVESPVIGAPLKTPKVFKNSLKMILWLISCARGILRKAERKVP